MKKVYFDVRAFSKEVKTIRIDVKVVTVVIHSSLATDFFFMVDSRHGN